MKAREQSNLPGLRAALKLVRTRLSNLPDSDRQIPGLIEAASVLNKEIWAWEKTERTTGDIWEGLREEGE